MDIFEFFNIFSVFSFVFPLFLVIIFLKKILFWLYLWQLKEYHIGRFLDHFSTTKGKGLLFNKVNLLKLFFLFVLVYSHLIPDDPPVDTWLQLFIFVLLGLFFVYTIESLKTIKDFFLGKIKRPVFTKKIIILLSLIIFITSALFYFIFQKGLDMLLAILTFDLFIPPIVSVIVLLFQPLAVLGRNQIVKKAKQKREQFKNLLVIGITGSYGKTSTKEFLATILSEKFKVLKTKEHQNSEVGISQCILNDLKEEHEIFIAEMGAYNRGGIKLLCDIAKPKIGVVTGVNEQHLATFGKMENLLSAEGGGELIESLPEDGIAFFNAKNKHCLELYKRTKIKKFLYGENATFAGGENILGAMAAAKELGMTDEEISRGVEKIENKFPGIQIKKGIEGINVIDATYSANPDGVIAHLEYLENFTGRKIIVMPCLIELGSASKEVHKKIGKKIAEVCDLAIITTRDRFKEIKDGSASSPQGGAEVLFFENPQEILEKIKSFCKEGDAVLLESRVPGYLIKELII